MESFTKTDILNQVERICKYPDIKSKKLICRFLRFIVDETISGRGDQLKGYSIGVNVFGKDADFDPEHDSLVRIHAGRLRRSLRIYYLDKGKNDQIHIEIPKGGYQPVFTLIEAKNTSYLPDNIHGHFNPREPSVVVLPFKNLTGNPHKEYFSFGFSEELSVELTKYEDLNIINCWHRPGNDSSEDLYKKYGARYLIDGSVQLNDQNLHILVKLVDTISGKQVWAERYSRSLSVKSLIDIQEEIADTVAKTIGSEVGILFHELTLESNRIKSENLQVFDAILKFYFYEAHMSAHLSAETFQDLQQALKEDPNSGIIHAMLANMYGNAYALDYPNSEGSIEKMVELVEKAMRLDPESQVVRIIYVFTCFIRDQKERFFQEVDHCLNMNLYSPMRLGTIGFHLSLFGEWERGKELLDKAMNKNIGYPLYFHGVTSLYFYRLGKCQEAYNEALKYDIPGLFWGPMLRIACLGKLNRKNDATSEIEQLMALKPDFVKKSNFLISRFIKEEELVKTVTDGLKKAGLKV